MTGSDARPRSGSRVRVVSAPAQQAGATPLYVYGAAAHSGLCEASSVSLKCLHKADWTVFCPLSHREQSYFQF